MIIIQAPWIAIHIDTGRIRVAYSVAEKGDGPDRIVPLVDTGHHFDMLFHYSASEKRWRIGAEAREFLDNDSGEFVSIPSNPLRWNQPMSLSDGTQVRPVELVSRLLRQVKDYCETNLFYGEPVHGCVISIMHRYNSIRTVFRRLAEDAGFEQILFRDAMVAGALFWKSEWQKEPVFVLAAHIGHHSITTVLLEKKYQGYEKTALRSHTALFGTEQITAHLLRRLSVEDSSMACLSTGEQRRLSKYCLERLRGTNPGSTTVILGGRTKEIGPSQWNEALDRFLSNLHDELAPYLEKCLKKTPVSSEQIPLIVLGMGYYDEQDHDLEEMIQKHLGSGLEGCYFWQQSEYAIPMGLTLMLQPKRLPRHPSTSAKEFYQLYLNAMLSGNYRAQYHLGRKLANGSGTCRNEEEAVDWLRLAAKQGYPKAKYHLACMIAQDKGADFEPRELDELVRALEGMGFQMQAFRQAAECFQHGRELEIESQRVVIPGRREEIKRLKSEAEELFLACWKHNRCFPALRPSRPAPSPPMDPLISGGYHTAIPSVPVPKVVSGASLFESWLGCFEAALVLVLGGVVLLQDAPANTVARLGAGTCFLAFLILLPVLAVLSFRLYRKRHEKWRDANGSAQHA